MSRRSLLGSATSNLWLTQFGTFTAQGNALEAVWGSAVGNRFHAEAHHDRILGADFTYSATITADWRQSGLGAHLQFRISDEGRYGVRVGGGQVAFYRMALEDRACADDPKILAHCPLWPADPDTDDPIETPLGRIGSFDPALPAITLTIVAQGTVFFVLFGTPTQQLGELPIQDGRLGIGRFGLYAIADTQSLQVEFTDVAATIETTLQSNFALLYRTAGYDLDGTKRALVRTINDVDPNDINEAGSSFTVTNSAGVIKVDGRPFESFVGTPALRRTLGFQFLAVDFSDVREPGRYTLEARLATPNGVRLLTSLPFEIAPRVVSGRMLWGLSILNAKARRAADDGFRRSWFIESGTAAWSVGLDGAFIADRAEDGAGATLVRGRNIFNRLFSDPDVSVTDFRMVARVTVVSGCDAQLQFRITGDERWAVTLQTGDAGGCAHGHGPGAVRLHREGPAVPRDDHFEILTSYPLENPFQIGRAYDVEVRTLGQHIEVMLDGNRVIDYQTSENPRAGTFALKAWASTVRFSHMKVWARHVGLSRPVPGVWIPYNRATGKSSQGFAITKVDFENNGVPPDSDRDLDYPLAAQYHGFHDCNSFIGEITSHAVFLAALMEVWTTRASADKRAATGGSPPRDRDCRALLERAVRAGESKRRVRAPGAWARGVGPEQPGAHVAICVVRALGLCGKGECRRSGARQQGIRPSDRGVAMARREQRARSLHRLRCCGSPRPRGRTPGSVSGSVVGAGENVVRRRIGIVRHARQDRRQVSEHGSLDPMVRRALRGVRPRTVGAVGRTARTGGGHCRAADRARRRPREWVLPHAAG